MATDKHPAPPSVLVCLPLLIFCLPGCDEKAEPGKASGWVRLETAPCQVAELDPREAVVDSLMANAMSGVILKRGDPRDPPVYLLSGARCDKVLEPNASPLGLVRAHFSEDAPHYAQDTAGVVVMAGRGRILVLDVIHAQDAERGILVWRWGPSGRYRVLLMGQGPVYSGSGGGNVLLYDVEWESGSVWRVLSVGTGAFATNIEFPVSVDVDGQRMSVRVRHPGAGRAEHAAVEVASKAANVEVTQEGPSSLTAEIRGFSGD